MQAETRAMLPVMVASPTTLSQLSIDQFGQLIDVDLYPQGPCPLCKKPRSVKVWGEDGWRWSARCVECEAVIPAQYVTFVTAEQLHFLIEHDGVVDHEFDVLKPN